MRVLGFTLALAPLTLGCESATLTHNEVTSHDAIFDGMRVHYQNAGAGDAAIVFVHGWSCDASFWRFQIPALNSLGRLIAIDLPGHGTSDKPDIAYSVPMFARAIDAVLVDAGVDRAVLVGHSNGTAIVRQFYRQRPRKTRALVTVDGSLRPFVTDPAQAEPMIAPLREADYKEYAQRAVIVGMFPASMPDELRHDLERRMLETPQNVMVDSLVRSFDRAIWTNDEISAPLLVINAKQPMWSDEYEELVRSLAPRVSYHVLDGVSHMLMLEVPERFNGLVTEFARGL